MTPFQDPVTIMNAKDTNGIGAPALVSDFANIVFAVNSTGNAALTLKFQVSYQKTMPDFSAAQSPTNQWDYVRVVDLEDGSAIDGDTGITFASADDNRMLEADVNGAMWVNAIVSGRSAGAVTVKGTAKNK